MILLYLCDLKLCCHDGNIVSSLNPEIFIIIHLKLSCLRIIDELNFMRLKSSTLWKYLILEHSLFHQCLPSSAKSLSTPPRPPAPPAPPSRSLIEEIAGESSSHVILPAEHVVGQQMVNTAWECWIY